jgi:chemotaxis protein methyltransferase CheR
LKVSPQQLAVLAAFLRRRSGVVVDQSKAYLIEARLQPVLRQRGIPDFETLVQKVRGSREPALEQDVLNAMMTHETSFFRDRAPFETVKQLLPELLKRRAVARHLVIWSAAASSGQEAYSLAMLLNEQFREALAGWSVRILATDFSEPVLARARAGLYSDFEVARHLPVELRDRYFVRLQGKWSIAHECRKYVEFRQMNLLDPWQGVPPCDIAFLRNVLIYFDVQTRAAILAKMRLTVRPDGALFLGGAETMLGVCDTYERVEGVGCSFYRPRSGPAVPRR